MDKWHKMNGIDVPWLNLWASKLRRPMRIKVKNIARRRAHERYLEERRIRSRG